MLLTFYLFFLNFLNVQGFDEVHVCMNCGHVEIVCGEDLQSIVHFCNNLTLVVLLDVERVANEDGHERKWFKCD